MAADPVLTALTQVEIELRALVTPNPPLPPIIPQKTDADLTNYTAWISESHISMFAGMAGAPTVTLTSVKVLLAALYKVDFIKTLGTTLPTLIDEVAKILKKIADELGPQGSLGGVSVSDLTNGVAGLKTFLNAVQKLPGSPAALVAASDVLAQITGLLDDIPNARIELYIIVQQLDAFSKTFANP